MNAHVKPQTLEPVSALVMFTLNLFNLLVLHLKEEGGWEHIKFVLRVVCLARPPKSLTKFTYSAP